MNIKGTQRLWQEEGLHARAHKPQKRAGISSVRELQVQVGRRQSRRCKGIVSASAPNGLKGRRRLGAPALSVRNASCDSAAVIVRIPLAPSNRPLFCTETRAGARAAVRSVRWCRPDGGPGVGSAAMAAGWQVRWSPGALTGRHGDPKGPPYLPARESQIARLGCSSHEP